MSRAASVLIGTLCCLTVTACAEEPRYDAVIAAASDTRDAFTELAAVLNAESGVNIGFVFGSSGLLREQVLADAPYDVYVSANTSYVDELVAAGMADGKSRQSFATGRLAIISAATEVMPNNLTELLNLKRIVIANPAHAPYGVAAREALLSVGIYAAIQDRLIYADNISDAVRIVDAGEADAGIVAVALVMQREHVLVPQALHSPIRQGVVLTKRGMNNEAARAFIAALSSSQGRALLERYGFTVES